MYVYIYIVILHTHTHTLDMRFASKLRQHGYSCCEVVKAISNTKEFGQSSSALSHTHPRTVRGEEGRSFSQFRTDPLSQG